MLLVSEGNQHLLYCQNFLDPPNYRHSAKWFDYHYEVFYTTYRSKYSYETRSSVLR
eukprot:TRINITY_DN14360_c0_g1_i1.p1 TRINITY_DN14360_c0_g1~~TRINITY_DN14360_c0_g1_i1.p1  ORF type:complete len:56 (-),score=1.15 TRINITY_DN14360_c0_g1_i1:284-451(-)